MMIVLEWIYPLTMDNPSNAQISFDLIDDISTK
jgi:hypothetical protein